MDFRYRAEPLEGHFLETVRRQAEAAGRAADGDWWQSFWLLIRKADRVCLGSADFKGPPDELGAVEIGYGLGREFEHNGYMTEAVRAMCGWALGQAGVYWVLAETETENMASQRVLARCGFALFRRGATLWWRLGAEGNK